MENLIVKGNDGNTRDKFLLSDIIGITSKKEYIMILTINHGDGVMIIENDYPRAEYYLIFE